MRVQFVWFNLNCTPKVNLGVALLMRELDQAGHRVDLIHLNEQLGVPLGEQAVGARLRDFAPELLALSFGRNHFSHLKALLPLLRRVCPHTPILCGGVHTTLMPEQVLALEQVDYLCLGEADGLLVQFVNRLQEGAPLEQLPSFWGKNRGSIWRNPMASPPDLDNQTPIDFEHIDHLSLLRHNRGMFELVSGRGCPGSCSFCFNGAMRSAYRRHLSPGARWSYCRKRGIENLLGEMRQVTERFGPELKLFSFADDAFNFDTTWTREFCRAYRQQLQLPFACNIMVQHIDEVTARELGRAGAIAKIGVETGNERLRREVLKKSFDNDTIVRAHNLLRRYRVPTRIYMLVGIPGEDEANVWETFEFVAGLRPSSTRLCIFYPVEGTPLYESCRNQQLLSGREYENYDDLSVLRWPAQMAMFLEKVHLAHPWFLNCRLDERCRRLYQPHLQKLLQVPVGQWREAAWKSRYRLAAEQLHERASRQGIEHYHNPFPERPDVTFLYGPGGAGLPNAD